MYDAAQRAMKLESLAKHIAVRFALPWRKLFVSVSYPPAGAHRRQPANLDHQWTGNPNETHGFLAINPAAVKNTLGAAKAILWGLLGTSAARRQLGLVRGDNGDIIAPPDIEAALQNIIQEVGELPPGHGQPPPPGRTRTKTYLCACPGPAGKVYRNTNTPLRALCLVCQTEFQLKGEQK